MTATATSSSRKPNSAVRKRRPRPRVVAGVAARYTLLVVVLVITVGPFLWQLSTALKGPAENVFSYPPDLLPNNPTLENFRAVADAIPVFRYIGNSLVYAVASTIGNCLFGAMAGYALARMRFRGRSGIFALLIASLVIPFEIIMVSVFLVTQQLGAVNSLVGVILPTLVTPLSIFIMRQAFLAVPPELEEAGTMDGASEWQTFSRVLLPSVRGSLAVVAIFSFMFAWDDFLWPLIVLRDPANLTLTVGIEFLSGTFSADQRLIAAGVMIAVIPLIILFVFVQKHFFRGVGEGAVKG